MDAVYQAIKNFFRSFINLFVAVIDLLASLVNLLAFILGKLRPHISDKYAEMRREQKERGALEKAIGKNSGKKEGIEDIRRELIEQVTDKDTYYQVCAHMEEEGAAGYGIILAVLFSLLSAGIVLASYRRASEMCAVFILAAALLCGAACFVILRHHKKIVRNRLIKKVMEEELKEALWGKPVLNKTEESHKEEEKEELSAGQPEKAEENGQKEAEKAEDTPAWMPENSENDFSDLL